MKLYYYIAILISISLISCDKKQITENNAIKGLHASTKIDNTNISTTIQPVPQKQDSTKYYIYLTFDDGPQLPGTRNCEHILKENNIKATFFMIGVHNFNKERQTLVDSINNNQLFILGNHSDTHAFRNKFSTFYNSPKLALNDFITAEKKLNIKNKFARLPGRNTWAIDGTIKGEKSGYSVAKKLDSIGYKVYGWDLEWDFKDGNIPVESVDKMIKRIDHMFKKGHTHRPRSMVILAHDRMFDLPQYADSLRKFITVLKNNNNYIFDNIENYPNNINQNTEKNKTVN